ncbi:MAG TPA: type IV pilus twitching motility protein PilT [Firmicutes bacterium]|nr:type IV pilus twitching motility protein PilT [Bacillota bacterium]
MELADLLRIAVEKGASDLHLTTGRPPVLRINGELTFIEGQPVLTKETIPNLLEPALTAERKAELDRNGQVDFSYGLPGLGRFRVNVFNQRSTVSAVMRLIPHEIPSFERLGLPEVVRDFTEKNRGMVLITGPTGSGKSTTLASLIDIINTNRSCHIITLEDPIEYLHHHGRSLVNQREIGTDTASFPGALRAALREDPDVILVGEMRDFETIQTALTAAETGHLVFATLHTNDATQTVDRIIDVFPPHQQAQIRIQLSLTLQGIVSQQLLPRADIPGRVLACEVLVATSAVRNIIREGKTYQLPTVMQTGGKLGMQTMDSSLRDLYRQRKITIQEALLRASDPEEFKRMVEF